MKFSTKEVQDLVVAWIALGVAFTFFLAGPGIVQSPQLLVVIGVSMLTVGIGFLLHELAHKVTAIRFGQVAEFRADYGMLLLAVGAGLAGFLFAAPGAVYHGGRNITKRENGLIALAGPVTNLLLAAVFAPLAFGLSGALGYVGQLGLTINLLLAGFNMLPFGPLDGKSVFRWSKIVFIVFFLPSAALALLALFRFGLT
ncbi:MULTISPECIES: metalloprotease [unclassified Haladaptatus]|uniref:metalloprotease n=1 Tax=unclassified Haladaptatus TaxID=2622732 RepID=UPI0023E83529|nr:MULTISPECIES: metalloprotease [unclassified Haladaptatus]